MRDLDFEPVLGYETSEKASSRLSDFAINSPVCYSFVESPSQTEQAQLRSPSLPTDFRQSDDQVQTKRWENNQRQFTRCPIGDGQKLAVLSIGGRRFDCRLVELSIGGFGVVVPKKVHLDLGKVGSLRAPGFNYVVGVTRQETRPEGVFIGLKQLEEVLDHDQHLPGDPSPLVGYLIAGLAGVLIAVVAYYFLYGK